MKTVNIWDDKEREKMNDCERQMFDSARGTISDLEYFYNDGEIPDSDGEPLTLWDYFGDVLDIRYIVGARREYIGVELCLAWGGPAIYLDTYNGCIKCRWWGDAFDVYVPHELCALVDDVWAEYYEMTA